jgi:hypothetical protein
MHTYTTQQWFAGHLDDPFPSDDEKVQLCAATNLTLTQISTWFINERKRVLKPLRLANAAAAAAAVATDETQTQASFMDVDDHVPCNSNNVQLRRNVYGNDRDRYRTAAAAAAHDIVTNIRNNAVNDCNRTVTACNNRNTTRRRTYNIDLHAAAATISAKYANIVAVTRDNGSCNGYGGSNAYLTEDDRQESILAVTPKEVIATTNHSCNNKNNNSATVSNDHVMAVNHRAKRPLESASDAKYSSPDVDLVMATPINVRNGHNGHINNKGSKRTKSASDVVLSPNIDVVIATPFYDRVNINNHTTKRVECARDLDQHKSVINSNHNGKYVDSDHDHDNNHCTRYSEHNGRDNDYNGFYNSCCNGHKNKCNGNDYAHADHVELHDDEHVCEVLAWA